MATVKTDVVIVGVGAAGGVIAAELAKAGMKVIGLERGPRLKTADFQAQDELRFAQRQELCPDVKLAPGRRVTLARGADIMSPCAPEMIIPAR
jgi:choline dehydrogenase-like flavoprotein